MYLLNLFALKYVRHKKHKNRTSTSHQSLLLNQSGVIMKDLVALETAIKDHVEHNDIKLINFHKMVQVSDILNKVTGLRETSPDVVPDKELSNIMRVSEEFASFSH